MKGSLLELSLPAPADGGGQEEGDAAKNYAKILPTECTVKLYNYCLLRYRWVTTESSNKKQNVVPL